MIKGKNKEVGFSKKNKQDKTAWVQEYALKNAFDLENELAPFQHPNKEVQKILDGFSENTLGNFPMPFGVAPHFVINGQEFIVPMVTEESSVVAAASNAAKFWKSRGGIKAEVLSTIKLGHIHFFWNGQQDKIHQFFKLKKEELENDCKEYTAKMQSRGGGIVSMELLDMTEKEAGYFKIEIKFETCDSMGANFINTVLEKVGSKWKYFIQNTSLFKGSEKEIDIVLCILSNYTPDCIVRAEVSCKLEELGHFPNDMTHDEFGEKFYKAIKIAKLDPYRATTHNKGIFNGVDAVVLATGNDFRAVEACGHTYAAKSGQYTGLSTCTVENDIFHFYMDLPLALGTVGGLTNLHPIAKISLQILQNPSATQLMKIVASAGLMQNFAAIKSLVTTGIQQGHMKMHLSNILNQLQATENEFSAAVAHFSHKIVSFSNVRDYLTRFRKLKTDS